MGKEYTEVKGVIAAKFSLNGTPLWISFSKIKDVKDAQAKFILPT